MRTNSTFELCGSFGHNFTRTTGSENTLDEIKCKHCELTVTLNKHGDFDESTINHQYLHALVKKLFLLRSWHRINKRRLISG